MMNNIKNDRKRIEGISISALKNIIMRTSILDEYINDKDKEPSWDGYVCIYKNEKKEKKNILGRVFVQVKGKVSNDLLKKEISYSVNVSDLKNYLNDGGVIYFAIYINEALETKVYYSELTPIKLNKILSGLRKQKQKSIKFKAFPQEEGKVVNIFMNFWENSRRQSSFSNDKCYALNELMNMANVERIEIPYSLAGGQDFISMILENEMYAYAKIEGIPAVLPINDILTDAKIFQTINVKISIEDKVYYNSCSIIKSLDETKIKIGESITFTLGQNAGMKFHYENSSKLKVLRKDLNFIIDVIEYGGFKIGDVVLPICKNNIKSNNFDIEEQKKLLISVNKIIQTLEFLNYYDDLSFKELSHMDIDNLRKLSGVFIDNRYLEDAKQEYSTLLYLKVGKLKFALIFSEIEKHKFTLLDFFKSKLDVYSKDENNEIIAISQYMILKSQDMIEFTNFRADKLLLSFKEIESINRYNYANNFLLELLSAYDKSHHTRRDILSVAKDFSIWLLEANDSDIDYNIRLLNYYQVIKRERELNDIEKESLWTIVESQKTSFEIKIASYILLNESGQARRMFYKQSLEWQEKFKNYPIFNFFKESL